jgi:hypothetical protein
MPEKDNLVKSLIPYDVNRGGQVIEKLDLTFINHNRKSKLFHYATSKLEDIKKQYNQTIALWEWNEYVDTFDINFDPVVGKTYYLYEASTKFVSLLSPTEFKRECVGAAKLNSDGYWEKVIL